MRAVVNDYVEAFGRALAGDAVEQVCVLLPAGVDTYAARRVFYMDGVEGEADDKAAK